MTEDFDEVAFKAKARDPYKTKQRDNGPAKPIHAYSIWVVKAKTKSI